MARRQAGDYDSRLPRCRPDGRQRHQQVAEVGAAQIEFDGDTIDTGLARSTGCTVLLNGGVVDSQC